MDNLRFFLFLAFSFLLYLLWDAWQMDYGPQPPVTQQQISQSGSLSLNEGGPSIEGIPDLNSELEPNSPLLDSMENQGQQIITVKTDTLHVEIDTRGGDIRVVDLLQYPVEKDQPDQKIRLLDQSAQKLFVSQTGFISKNQLPAPSHSSLYQAEKTEYTLTPEQDQISVPLVWEEDGIRVTKIYTFARGSYLINLKQQLGNQSASVWKGSAYTQLQQIPPSDDESSMFIHTYTGGVFYSDSQNYEKISFDKMQEEDAKLKTKGGWTAMIQHYFLAAWVADPQEENTLYSKSLAGNRYIVGSYPGVRQVAPGNSETFTSELFVGPKLQHQLEAISPGLELTVDYGLLTFIGKPIFWLLETFHSLVSNWGGAIILTTLIIKLCFYPLSATSYRSMANMRKLQPRLQALRERCGDDRQKLNQQMMELYRKEKVNPLGGCLPILLQIPVFISLYWVLIESVELRQAPFFAWINDLSSKDPYFVLPLLMGISMAVQQHLNPAPVDPIQAKVMKVFPWVFTVFFAFFPAGLVLYWVVNNVLSILQQWYITRQIEASK